MAIPILHNWKKYFYNIDEGLGSSYERIVINHKLAELCKKYEVTKLLESPSFGFTGISGINSFSAAKAGIELTITDHNRERLNLIEEFWLKYKMPISTKMVEKYEELPFEKNQFEMSWNFSAMWFTDNLYKSLSELCRVTTKAIFISVPNRTGLGYLSQKILEKEELSKYLNEENIIPKNIISQMDKLGWKLIETDYIDCPWWPDIGMPKAKFLKIFGLGWLLKNREHQPISIMDHYTEKDMEFTKKMMKHYWFEKNIPNFIKKIWSHHKYYLFEKK